MDTKTSGYMERTSRWGDERGEGAKEQQKSQS